MAKKTRPDSLQREAPALETRLVTIQPLRESVAEFDLQGITPYLQLRFSQKAKTKMQTTQEAGQQAKGKRIKEARDFEADFTAATYRMADDSYGIPAAAFRNAMISACRTIGFKMTIAKLSIFIEPDGFDVQDGTPLVRIAGAPESKIDPVRNANGVADLRVRAMWRHWGATVRVRWDTQQFSPDDVYNLLMRAGKQVGVGEGRPDSRNSAGLGMGMFEIKQRV